MKRLIPLILICVGVALAVGPINIKMPGLSGMVSNVDFTENKITDSRWSLNSDINTNAGLIGRRFGIKTLGNNAQQAISAYGFVSPDDRRKQIVLSIWNASNLKTGNSTTYDPPDTANKVFGYSNVFESGYDATVPFGGVLMSGEIFFLQAADNLLAFDGRTMPALYVDEQSTEGSYINEPDSTYYSPRMVSLGLEAPGQPRVSIMNETSTQYGYYRYSYRQALTEAIDGAAIASPWMFIDSQKVAVSMFELTARAGGSVRTDTIHVIRQKLSDVWRRSATATVIMHDTATCYFIDDNTDTWAATAFEPVIDSFRPGALNRTGVYTDTALLADSSHIATEDTSEYWVAYSYYDQVLNIESPLGPYEKGSVLRIIGADTLLPEFKKGWSKSSERPGWIRAYRSLAGDSSILYGMWQLRANQLFPSDTTAAGGRNLSLAPGWVSDSELTTGLVFWSDTADNTYSYGEEWCEVLTDGGVALTRPPFITNNEIPYSTMAYANGRLWGAGDPLYPNRVYYADYDELTGWLATNYIQCGQENDAIVVMKTLGGSNDEILYVFRHNDIWAILGYDAEVTVYPAVESPARARVKVTDKSGAVSQKSTVQANDAIYYLSPDMKVYRLGDKLDEISQPIENYIDSYFVDLYHADSHVVAYRLEDKVIWYDSTSDIAFAYSLMSGTWGLESYADNFRPSGSFAYDTNQAVYGRAERSYWLYQSDSACQFRVEYNAFVDSTDTAYAFPFNMESPMIGDGQGFYMIQEVQVTATLENGSYLIGYIINEDADTVATDSVQLWGYSTFRMGFPHHIGRYLSLRFSVSADTAMIHDVAIYPIGLGQSRTE